jgi:truncated hemoglobin YjbI
MAKELPILLRSELGGIWKRLGGGGPGGPGEIRLRAILDDFYRRLASDLLVGFFFEGKDLGKIARAQGDFLMRAMGATQSYSGKPPAQAHLGLAPILAGHFDRRLRVLEETLAAHGVPEQDIRTWVRFEGAFRDGIQGEEGPLKR